MAETKTKSLASKLAYITGEMRAVKKEGFNKAQNYAFVRETDVAEKLSALLAEQNIFLHQTVIAHSMKPLYITGSGSQMWLCEVTMDFHFIDGETGNTTPIASFPGHGADTGDKGIYKAMTGAEKYMIMKTFLVSTGDDPEADEKVDKAAASTGAAKGPVKVTKGTQAGVQRGGKSDGATTAQVSEIAKQAKTLGLDADGIVPVIAKILGSEPAEGVSIRDWLSGLTSQQAGDIITALAGMATFADVRVDETVETVDNTVEETTQETFTVV
jgi:hypothetical protein